MRKINLADIKVVRSNRKTISLEIKSDLQMIVRAPYRVSDAQIRQFIEDKSAWIEKHFAKMEDRTKETVQPFRREEIEELADRALKDIPERVRYYAPLVGVTYGRITIRNQRTRWGSCSGKGNLNFNCLLMLCPPETRDYVVVHELCHRREMNHSLKFWAEVERILPDYKMHKKWLNENGGQLIRRMEAMHP